MVTWSMDRNWETERDHSHDCHSGGMDDIVAEPRSTMVVIDALVLYVRNPTTIFTQKDNKINFTRSCTLILCNSITCLQSSERESLLLCTIINRNTNR
jgi:hypothetical protein